ncbi:uncharacterized protein C3orf38 homolog [Halichoeres trimaculatus]|uniref:uncharacterized protein C3orf38 homolog n=1 Tax=Halichoeres trimaculatus TaxID=147232 RepID=UPI003D9F8369
MPGLSETEQAGCTKILNLMSKGDLLSLCDTVTGKMIVVEDETEAIKTVLSFTQNAEEFLKRKKVYRELIFKYLAKEGVSMPPNSEKHQLVKRALELWSPGKEMVGRSPPTASDITELKAKEDFDPQVLGQHFCQWFYKLLNSQNPSLGQQPQEWGPQHFWPDVKLNLLVRGSSEQMEEFLGAEMVSLRLQALTKEEQLLLCPNLEPRGLKVLASPHGLVRVAVAGTIHRSSTCLGIFEQVFGLIRPPLQDNNWKIKVMHMKIKVQDALEGTEIAAPALTYNSTDLQLLCS